MHDPMVVAFEIRRPWPKREPLYDVDRNGRGRWSIRLRHKCDEYCEDREEHAQRDPFPWWNPRSYSPFWTLAGKGFYWPSFITVWHVEPRGHDSGEVCKHHTRYQDENGKWRFKFHHGWRFHVHHWHIQISPLQSLRRWLLTRCAWCGGHHRKGDPVNLSHSWDGPRGRWWQGAPGVYHHDCSSIASAWASCVCERPVCDDYSPTYGPYGACAVCGKRRPFGRTEAQMARLRLLADVPKGGRDRAVYERYIALAKADRSEETA